MFYELNDNRAHGEDERADARIFFYGVIFNNLLRTLSHSS